jgi:hypothetical protein
LLAAHDRIIGGKGGMNRRWVNQWLDYSSDHRSYANSLDLIFHQYKGGGNLKSEREFRPFGAARVVDSKERPVERNRWSATLYGKNLSLGPDSFPWRACSFLFLTDSQSQMKRFFHPTNFSLAKSDTCLKASLIEYHQYIKKKSSIFIHQNIPNFLSTFVNLKFDYLFINILKS